MKRWLSFLLAAVMLITGMLTICSFAAQSEAQTFLSLLNQRRSAQGLATLGTDGGLMDAAAVRAKEQSARTSHYRPDGSYFNSVNSKAEAECYWWFEPAETGTAQEALDAFMNSPDHRALLMHRQVRSAGAAYYDAGGRRYWVVLLSHLRHERHDLLPISALHARTGGDLPLARRRLPVRLWLRLEHLPRRGARQLLRQRRRMGGFAPDHKRHGQPSLLAGRRLHPRGRRDLPLALFRLAVYVHNVPLPGRAERQLLRAGGRLGGEQRRLDRHRNEHLLAGSCLHTS